MDINEFLMFEEFKKSQKKRRIHQQRNRVLTQLEFETLKERFNQCTLESAYLRDKVENQAQRKAIYNEFINREALVLQNNNLYSEKYFFNELDYKQLLSIKEYFKMFLESSRKDALNKLDKSQIFEQFGSEYAPELNCIEAYLADTFLFNTFDYDINLEGMIETKLRNVKLKLNYTEEMKREDELHAIAKEDAEKMKKLHLEILDNAYQLGFKGTALTYCMNELEDPEIQTEVYADKERHDKGIDVESDCVTAECKWLIQILEKQMNKLEI